MDRTVAPAAVNCVTLGRGFREDVKTAVRGRLHIHRVRDVGQGFLLGRCLDVDGDGVGAAGKEAADAGEGASGGDDGDDGIEIADQGIKVGDRIEAGGNLVNHSVAVEVIADLKELAGHGGGGLKSDVQRAKA